MLLPLLSQTHTQGEAGTETRFVTYPVTFSLRVEEHPQSDTSQPLSQSYGRALPRSISMNKNLLPTFTLIIFVWKSLRLYKLTIANQSLKRFNKILMETSLEVIISSEKGYAFAINSHSPHH